ncbi:MAG: hypothetical protein IRZ18_08905 [Clostridia bacterium]|nr:hypothetical protein [Clostridia bacterium]
MRWMFMKGLLWGIALTAAAGAAGGAYVMRHGVVARVDASPLTADVQAEIRQQVLAEMPRVIEAVKAQVPAKVAEEVNKQLGDASFVLYGVRVDLPATATQALRDHLRDEITREFQKQLDSIDVDGLATAWADQASTTIARTLHDRLIRRSLPVEVVPGVTIPIVVDIR